MVALLARWPLSRAVRSGTRPDRLLRDNPVLLLSALQAPDTVAGLVGQWNPAWRAAGRAQPDDAMPTAARNAAADKAGHEASAGSDEPIKGSIKASTEGPIEGSTEHPVAVKTGGEHAPSPDQPPRAETQDTRQPTDPAQVAEGVRWHGPIRLTPMLRADAGLPSATWLGVAYVAEVRRDRVKIAYGRHASLLAQRYPRGLPSGAEAEAWQLVRGLAKRLRGVAVLPGGPVYAPHEDPLPLPGDTDQRVYSHEMLPWIVLREVLRPIAPDLSRETLPDQDGYILRHRGLLEVRVRPAGPDTRLPYTLRDRADDAWPHSVYEFCDLSAPTGPAESTASRQTATATARAVRSAAALIAEITGGVLIDADGFPMAIRAITASPM